MDYTIESFMMFLKPHDRPSQPPTHNTMALIKKTIARSTIPPPPPPLFLFNFGSTLSTIGTTQNQIFGLF